MVQNWLVYVLQPPSNVLQYVSPLFHDSYNLLLLFPYASTYTCFGSLQKPFCIEARVYNLSTVFPTVVGVVASAVRRAISIMAMSHDVRLTQPDFPIVAQHPVKKNPPHTTVIFSTVGPQIEHVNLFDRK